MTLHVPDCFRVYHTTKILNKQFRDQPNIAAQQGYVLKSIKINFARIKYKCTKLSFSPKKLVFIGVPCVIKSSMPMG